MGPPPTPPVVLSCPSAKEHLWPKLTGAVGARENFSLGRGPEKFGPVTSNPQSGAVKKSPGHGNPGVGLQKMAMHQRLAGHSVPWRCAASCLLPPSCAYTLGGGGGMDALEGDLRGGPRSGWTGGWRRLPKRLGAVTVGYKCR